MSMGMALIFGSKTSMFPAKEHLTLTPDERGFLWLDVETAAEKLAHDVPRDIINLMVA